MIDRYKNKLFQLLRRTEKYTKTDMVYLAHGGFWLFLKTFVGAAIAFGLSVAFANLLSPTTYGEYKYIFSIFGLLAITTLTGMGPATTRSVAQGYEGTPSAILKTKIQWGLIGSAASVGIAIYYVARGNLELAGAFAIVALFLPFVDSLTIYNSVLTGKKLFKISTLYEIVVQILSAGVIVTTLFLTNNLLIILVAYFVSYTLIRFFVFRFVVVRHATNTNTDPATTTYGKHLSAMGVLSAISEAVDTILLWQFIGPAQIAVYAFAKGIPVQISAALQRITTLAFPKFAQRDFKIIRSTIGHKMLIMLAVMIGIVGVYVFATPYIFAIFFPTYTEAVIYSQFFALSLLFFPQKFIGIAFQAHAHTKALYIANTIAPVIRIIIALALIPFFGIAGAIATELIGRMVNFIVLYTLLIRSKSNA